MHEPKYRQALLHSWQMVWSNKLLWVLGICSMILGQWGLGDFIGQMNLFVDEGFSMPPTFSQVAGILTTMNFDSITAAFLSLWFFILVAIFVAAIVFVAVVSRGALIAVAAEWYYDRKHLLISSAWHDGVVSFWALLSLTIVNKLLQTVIVLGFANFFIAALAIGSKMYNILAVVTFLISLFLVLVLETITIYASCYAVLERVWFGKAIKQGWNLFRRHIIVSIELGILLVILSLALLLVLAVGSVLVFVPASIIWVAASFSGWYILVGVGLALALILFILLAVLAGGLFSSFTTAAWVYLFMKMHHEGIASRMAHHLKNWLNIR